MERAEAERILSTVKKAAQSQNCTVEELIEFYAERNAEYAETLRKAITEAKAWETEKDDRPGRTTELVRLDEVLGLLDYWGRAAIRERGKTDPLTLVLGSLRLDVKKLERFQGNGGEQAAEGVGPDGGDGGRTAGDQWSPLLDREGRRT